MTALGYMASARRRRLTLGRRARMDNLSAHSVPPDLVLFAQLLTDAGRAPSPPASPAADQPTTRKSPIRRR